MKILNRILENKVPNHGFVNGLAWLAQQEVQPLSLRDYAREIHEAGNLKPPFEVYLPSGFVKEGVIYVPGERTLLVRESPLINLAKARELGDKLKQLDNILNTDYMGELTEDKYKECKRLENQLRCAVLEINPDSYLEMAKEDRKKAPEERRVFEVDYKKLVFTTQKASPWRGYLLNNENLEQEDIFRWAFQDYTKEQAEAHRKWDGGMVGKTFFMFGGPEIKNFFGDKPFVQQMIYTPNERGFLEPGDNERYLRGTILGIKRKNR